MKQDFDVIIVGAGMVGATLALLLSHNSQLQIGLIEAQPPQPLATGAPAALRVSAINRRSQQILQQAGIWELLDVGRLGPFERMQVWEQAGSELTFEAAEAGLSWLGHIIENQHLQYAAISRCRQQANISWLCPLTPTAFRDGQLILDNGQSLRAQLLVAADGGRSQLRDWAGIASRGWDYQQRGLVCTVQTELPHQQTAWQRFLADGPLAFLPLADARQCSIVWSLPAAIAETYCQLDAADFKTQLETAFDGQLGAVTLLSERQSFPLQLRHSQSYIQAGLALVGDAAHSIHPLAGQGVNIGFLDALALAEVVLTAAERGRQLGSLHTLSKYQRQRRADNLLMQLSMDAIHRLYSNQNPLLGQLRRLGMAQLQKQSVLKNLFIEHAIGQRLLPGL